nr:fatty acid amide hydrolase 1 [Hymenolepis microstoma]
MDFCLTALRVFFDTVSCAYVAVSLDLPAVASSFISPTLQYVQLFFHRNLPANIIFSLWICSRLGFKLFKLRKDRKHLKKKIKQRQDVISSFSAKLCGLKTPLDNVEKVQALSISELRHEIVESKKLTALDALEALQVHILRLMQSKDSSVAEIVFDADVTAIVIDQALKREGKPISPLHGIPVCLSNHFRVKGEDCNASAVFKACGTAGSDCALVRNLREVGAIPVAFAKTALLPGEPDASSLLYGTVTHPFYPDRVVGASSVATLIKQKGAHLGFSLDIIGDVRLEAMNLGIVGFKPTAQRLSTEGIVNAVNLPEFLPPTVGILGLHVTVISDAMKALTSVQLDPSLPLLQFEPSTSREPLSIGVYSNLPQVIPSTPGIHRVMLEVTQALKSLGHNVIDVELPNPETALNLVCQILLTSEGFWDVLVFKHHGNSLTWDEVFKCALPKIPGFLRGPLSLIVQSQQKAKCSVMKRLMKAWKKPLSPEEISDALEAYRRNFNEIWTDEEIDVLVGPVAPSSALKKKSPASLTFVQTGYTSIFNLVNCPAGVIPFGKVSKSDTEAAVNMKEPLNTLYGQLLQQQLSAQGANVGIQVVAKPWCDGVALRVMQELEGCKHA